MVIEIPVSPVPKPRMTRSDRWKERPATRKYWKFKDDLREHVTGELGASFSVVFFVPMPKSWSKKKRLAMNRRPHQQKPDVDNYLKALMDALCEDDSHVYKVSMAKYWAEEGSVRIFDEGELSD